MTTFFPAMSQELPVIHYGIKEGLPSVYINALTQGKDGRLWISHRAGLSAYDGAEFKNWSREDGLLGSSSDGIIVDNEGILWMTYSDSGLQYMEKDGTIHTVPDQQLLYEKDFIPFLYKMKDGSILGAGRKGYYKMSKEKIEGPFYPVQNKHGRITYILDLGRNRGILFATEDGVFNIKGKTENLLPLPYEKMGNRAMSVMATGKQEEIFFVSRNGWLVKWRDKKYQMWDLKRLTKKPKIAIFEIHMDPQKNLWIGTGDGLFHWNKGALERFTEDEGLSNRWINHLLIDREGILWLGTESGLDKISQMAFRNYRYKNDLPVNAVWGIDELPDGSIWIGTNSGIVIINKQGKYRVMTEQHGLPERSIVDIKAMEDGKVWVLSYSGIHLWNGKDFISYPYKPFSLITLWGLLPVNEDEIWIYTSTGIYILNPKTKKFTKPPFNEKIEDSAALENLVLKKNGDVFTLGRKMHVVKKDGSLEEIKLPSWGDKITIFNIAEDKNEIWLVTNMGLISYDWKTWKRYPVKEKQIFDMVKIRDGEFWFGCNTGIARFDGEEYNFFGFHDGVAVEECTTGSLILDRWGRVWFGGKNITFVDPAEICKYPSYKPLVTRVTVGEKSHLFPEKLEFSSRVKSVELFFSSCCFYNEQEQVFRFRMKGLEPDWSTPTKDHSVRYTNLPPGDHFFEVQSRQKFGNWNSPVFRLEIKVLPTFWQTPLAKIILFLAIMAAGFLISIVRVIHLKAQRKKLQKLVNEQTEEIRKQRDKVTQLARTDELTGLPNRRKLIEDLEIEMIKSRRNKRPLSLLIIDIDNFKDINDSYGHSVGDEVLRITAARGQNIIRKSDTFARWGGDEFVFLMPETKKDKAIEICERLKASIQSSPLNIAQDKRVHFSISGGISTWEISQMGDKNQDDLFKEADEALYKAKEEGRNRICHY